MVPLNARHATELREASDQYWRPTEADRVKSSTLTTKRPLLPPSVAAVCDELDAKAKAAEGAADMAEIVAAAAVVEAKLARRHAQSARERSRETRKDAINRELRSAHAARKAETLQALQARIAKLHEEIARAEAQLPHAEAG